jgi:ElaB/YqjD/DUF883 family membrane-anchored ribosome-binding protein
MTNQTGASGTDQEARSAVGEMAESAQETAQQAVQQVQDRAREAKGQAGSRVRRLVDERSGDAASQMQSTAEAMRRTGSQLREEGSDTPAKIAEAVAERTERVGRYLEHADADRMLRDLERFTRRQPWLVAAGGFLAGLLGSRFLKASSAGRYASANGSGTADGSPSASWPPVPSGTTAGVYSTGPGAPFGDLPAATPAASGGERSGPGR